jgi:hypothetical protein
LLIPDISSQLSSIVLLLWLVSELLREVGGVENEVIELLREIEGEGIETHGDSSLLNLVAFGLVVSKFESDNFLADGLVIPPLVSGLPSIFLSWVSWVKIRLHNKNQLSKLSESTLKVPLGGVVVVLLITLSLPGLPITVSEIRV